MSDSQVPTNSRSWRNWASFVFGIAISGVFVYLTLRQIDLDRLAAEMAKANLVILSLTLGTKLVGFLCMTWRSKILFRPVADLRIWRLFKSIMVAFVGNNLLPFRAGELLRVGYLSHDEDDLPASTTFATVALERLLDLVSLTLLFLTLIGFAFIDQTYRGVPEFTVVYLAASLLVVTLAAVMMISRHPSKFAALVDFLTRFLGNRLSEFVTKKAENFADGMAGLASWRQAAGAFVLSIGYWASAIASFTVWIWAFGLSLPWHAPLVIAIFTAFATILPSSPGFVGTYHYFLKTAVMFFGVGSATAASLAIVGHAAAFVPYTLIGIIVLLRDYLHNELIVPEELGPDRQ